MFLKILANDDASEEFWRFVLRLETVLYGVLTGAADRMATMTDDDLTIFLFDTLGKAMDCSQEAVSGSWWPTPAPSVFWFDDYIHRHLASLKKEAQRLAPLTHDERVRESLGAFDREKIRLCAEKNDLFAAYIAPEVKEHPHCDCGKDHDHDDTETV